MKKDRQARIIELVQSRNIETQEELAGMLREEGFDVTQATVSRDIRKLHLTKISAGNGHQKYATVRNDVTYAEKYTRVLKDSFVSMDIAQNILVLKTVSGMAMPCAAAIDHMHMPGIVGTIAGDDTVMAIVKTAEGAKELIGTIEELVNAN